MKLIQEPKNIIDEINAELDRVSHDEEYRKSAEAAAREALEEVNIGLFTK